MEPAADPDSKSAARTLYLVLRHNIQTFGTVLLIIKEELMELKQQMPLSDLVETQTDPADPAKKPPRGSIVQHVCMPLVRLYSSWLVATRSELHCATEDLQPGIIEMCTCFASVLTLLSEIYGGEDMKITPYLLPEDMLSRGLLPLSSQLLPPACELGFDQDRNVPKEDWEDWDQSHGIWSHEKELLARSLDILLCGFNLTEEGPLCFKWTQVDAGLEFYYESPTGSNPVTTPAADSRHGAEKATQATDIQTSPLNDFPIEASQAQALDTSVDSAEGQLPKDIPPSRQRKVSGQPPALQMPSYKDATNSSIPRLWETCAPSHLGNLGNEPRTSSRAQADLDRDVVARRQLADTTYYSGLGSSVWDSKFAAPYVAPTDISIAESTDYDFSNNTAVMDMVNDFLQPPSNPTRGQNANHSAVNGNDTSYGMHSVTADEVFNGLAGTSPSFAETHSPRAFPGLPWNLVYKPSPNHLDSSTSPRALATTPDHNPGLRVASQPIARGEISAANGSSAASRPWHEFAATPSDAPAGLHRARLLEAFGQPAASLGPARPTSRVTSQGHGSERSLYDYGGYAPFSSDAAFSATSSIYQSTPQHQHANVFNPKRPSGITNAGDYTDAYDDLVLRDVREDMAREHEARNRFS